MQDKRLSPLLRKVLDWLEPHVNDVEPQGSGKEKSEDQRPTAWASGIDAAEDETEA